MAITFSQEMFHLHQETPDLVLLEQGIYHGKMQPKRIQGFSHSSSIGATSPKPTNPNISVYNFNFATSFPILNTQGSNTLLVLFVLIFTQTQSNSDLSSDHKIHQKHTPIDVNAMYILDRFHYIANSCKHSFMNSSIYMNVDQLQTANLKP